MSKVALVTGAAQGIGKAIALQLAKDGYKVAIADLTTQESKANEVVDEIKSKIGQSSIFIPTDISERAQVFNAVDTTYKELGGFNTMVNNAGIAILGPLHTITPEIWNKISNTNIAGTLWGIQAASKKFSELGGTQLGKIINAGSVASHQGSVIFGAYGASKFAIRSLTQTAAKELASQNITVNCFCPGMTPTAMWESFDKMTGDPTGKSRAGLLEKVKANTALGRLAETQDAANLVSFLASDKSDYITGQSYLVDGGSQFV